MKIGKYVIVEERGHEVAVMFDSLIEHTKIAAVFGNVVSAGFFEVDPDGVAYVFGKSLSLKLESRVSDHVALNKVLKGE